MKTTLELPDDLVKAVKLLAVHEGKKLKDAVADLLRQGLEAAAAGNGTVVKADKAPLRAPQTNCRESSFPANGASN